MVSIKIIKEQLNVFLKSDSPEVIAIRGAWGTGKTYFWHQLFKESKSTIALKKYAYVSLFGLRTIEELKYAIFESTQLFDDDYDGTRLLERLKQDGTKFVAKAYSLIKSLSAETIPINIDFKLIAFSMVENMIICLDDFERTNLDAQALLGLISDLRETKRCKIVLIMNDEKLHEKNKEEYDNYKEKVIDKEFCFAPTPEECVTLVLRNNEQNDDILKERCCRLGIKNIRVINKIKQMRDSLTPLLVGCEERTIQNVLSSVVLFCYCYYVKDGSVPDFNFIKELNISRHVELLMDKKRDDSNGTSELHQQWHRFLRHYEYNNTDELDLQIADFVQNGYFDLPSMQKVIKKYDELIQTEKQIESFNKAWSLFHDGFEDNGDVLISSMYEATKNHIQLISVPNLNSAICLLRDLGADKEADELIELAISSHEDPSYFNIDDFSFKKYVKDKKLIERFTKSYLEKHEVKTPTDVLDKIVSTNSWGEQDLDILCNLSVSDFRDLFKTKKSYVGCCLDFERYANPTDKQKQIVSNAKEALKEIGRENILNSRRVEALDISIET